MSKVPGDKANEEGLTLRGKRWGRRSNRGDKINLRPKDEYKFRKKPGKANLGRRNRKIKRVAV